MRFDIPSLDGTEILTIEFRDGEDTAHTIARRPARRRERSDNLGRSVGMIQTASGILYDVVNPKPEHVWIEDIAHHLSQQCRYSGATKRFYSVAEHSIWVSLIVPPKYAREALLHDAAEAYCIDLPRPIKHLPEMGHYRELEWRNERAIAERFGFDPNFVDVEIVEADVEALACECRQLMPWRDAEWWWGDLARRPLRDATREASYVFQTRDYEKRRFTELLRFEPDPIEVRSTFLRRAQELGLT